jgi:predicted butyrate kinase (DUF1464 family)
MKTHATRAGLALVLSILGLAAATLAQDSGLVLKGDQASAVGCLWSINTSEAYYSTYYKLGWSPTLASLGQPQEGAKPSASAAGLITNSLASGQRSNYVFTYKAGKKDASGKITSYTVTASPVEWHKGLWSFFTDETETIRGTAENRAATASDPPIQYSQK